MSQKKAEGVGIMQSCVGGIAELAREGAGMQNNSLRSSWLKRWRWDLALAGCISAAVGILLVSELGHRDLKDIFN